jgi:two-component system, OmpR family, sensor histidine kinase TctE
MKSRFSVRRQLLKWLLVPLLILIAVDSTILYRISLHFLRKAFDHALYDTAYDVSQILTQNRLNNAQLELKPEVRSMLLSSQDDAMYYSVYDPQGRFLGGDKTLPYQAPQSWQRKVMFFVGGHVAGQDVRVVSMPAVIPGDQGDESVRIQVAETRNRRQHLASQILLGILVPQLLLLLVAVVLMWFGIGRGLRPLWDLHSALAQRSPRDLSPVQLKQVPEEVSMLVESINQLMQQVQRLLESQNRFIADAAHQLRTPLAGVMAQTELAQYETNPDALQKSLANIAMSTERLVHMVNQLLILARAEPEVMRAIQMHVLDLRALAQHVTGDLISLALPRNIDLGFESELTHAWVLGDATSLEEMLSNLVDNAIRYSDEGGRVTVSLTRDDQGFVLSVEDDGPGIPEDEREKVFERFHRVIGTEQPGSGLGLAIVLEIAQVHGATIQMQDATPEGGLRISLRFADRSAEAPVLVSAN